MERPQTIGGRVTGGDMSGKELGFVSSSLRLKGGGGE